MAPFLRFAKRVQVPLEHVSQVTAVSTEKLQVSYAIVRDVLFKDS